jgi:hypothetical protein
MSCLKKKTPDPLRRRRRRSEARACSLATALVCLSLTLGCGNAHQIDPVGNFSNARLKGNYSYSLAGVRVGLASGNGLYKEAGTFVADGNGHITAGFDDFVLQGYSVLSQTFTGSYDIAADGTGTINISVGGLQPEWLVTIASDSQLYLVEFDSYGIGGGGGRLQSVASFTTPSGSFAFRTHNVALHGSIAKVGSFTANSDGSLAGDADVLRQGTLASSAISGAITTPDANGRGTLTLTEDTGIVSNFFYYVIDSGTLNLLQIDLNSLGEGRAEQRASTTFNVGSLQNAFVYHSDGDTPLNIGGANTVGVFTSDGTGVIRAGSLDSVQDGNPISNAQITGTYNIDDRGRVDLVLNPQGFDPVEQVGWLVDSTRGFFLVNSSGRVEDGRFDQQQANSSGGTSLSGAFGFYMSGYDSQSPPLVSRLGVVVFDGQQTATFSDYFVNRSGIRTQKGGFSGTYTVSSNGRFNISVPGVSKTLIGYLIAPNVGYLLVGDPGAEEPGRLEQAPTP